MDALRAYRTSVPRQKKMYKREPDLMLDAVARGSEDDRGGEKRKGANGTTSFFATHRGTAKKGAGNETE